MCNKAVKDDPFSLQFVPDWFVSQQQLDVWYGNDYWYNDDDIIECYEGYKKQKAQKAKIKEEFLPIAGHPSTYLDWCVPEDEKKRDIKNGFFCLMTGHKIFWMIFKGINKMSALALRGNSFYGKMKEVLDHPPSSVQRWIKEIQETLKKFVQINPLSFTYLPDF